MKHPPSGPRANTKSSADKSGLHLPVLPEGPAESATRAGRNEKFPWITVGLAITAFFFGSVMLIRAPDEGRISTDPATTRTPVGLTKIDPTSTDEVTREEAIFRDPTPLFLPTPWNAGFDVAPPQGLASGPDSRFEDYRPKMTNSDSDVRLAFPPSVEVPLSPAGGLRVGERTNLYGAIGRREVPVEPFSARICFIEVVAVRDGRPVLAEAIQMMDAVPTSDWQPMELLVAIDATGLVGAVVVVGSGDETWDNSVRRYLAKQFRLGERLRSGFYRVSVGP